MLACNGGVYTNIITWFGYFYHLIIVFLHWHILYIIYMSDISPTIFEQHFTWTMALIQLDISS